MAETLQNPMTKNTLVFSRWCNLHAWWKC